MTSESENLLDTLPPIQPGATVKSQSRRFNVQLPTETYLKLEIESARRAVTSYKLASTIITMFLNGKLVLKQQPIEAPAESDLSGVNHGS
ncbi:hypothetical protein [Methylomonas sp. DH-1]|uniref:hypothetical protein n=1 Tax=Methylomonas sp. (strain DH-1) TaxID=1727196 RepID=UPI000ABF0A18|nr:hypothetical protein [Methylomonas sp. DH-1]